MIRNDIYARELNSGDYIVCLFRKELVAGQIRSISAKGVLTVGLWNGKTKRYNITTCKVRGSYIIKTAGMSN